MADLNAFYALKGPKTSSYEDFSGMMDRGFNLGRSFRDQYDRNSAKALIAQRESEGVPYDAISNEVAKYDLDMANSMRNERRSSLKYNYEQSKAEFENWRINMARRICGRILQIADVMNIAPEERYRILDTAASYVVTYDQALAEMLWQQARSRYYEQGRLDNAANRNSAGKPLSDDEKEIRKRIDEAANPKGDVLSDRTALLNRTLDAQAATRILKWKNDNPYDFTNNPEGRRVFVRMISVLRQKYKNGFDKLTDDQVTDAVSGVSGEQPTEPAEQTQDVSVTTGNGTVPQNPVQASPKKPAQAATTAVSSEENYGLVPLYKRDPLTSTNVSNVDAVGKLSDFVSDLDTEDIDFSEKVKAAKKILRTGTEIKDNDMKSLIGSIDDEIKGKEKEYKDYIKELKALGIDNPEEAFTKFKSLFGQRASMGTVVQFRNFNSFVNSYISNAPVTAISNGLLVGTPSYKPTLAEIQMAKNVHGDWSQSLRTVIQNTRLPFASQVASHANEYQALFALGQDVEKQIRGLWNSVSKGLSPEETKKLRKLYTDLFHIDEKAWQIIDGKSFPRGEEYDRQLEKMNGENNGKKNFVDLSGVDNGAAKTFGVEDFE